MRLISWHAGLECAISSMITRTTTLTRPCKRLLQFSALRVLVFIAFCQTPKEGPISRGTLSETTHVRTCKLTLFWARIQVHRFSQGRSTFIFISATRFARSQYLRNFFDPPTVL